MSWKYERIKNKTWQKSEIETILVMSTTDTLVAFRWGAIPLCSVSKFLFSVIKATTIESFWISFFKPKILIKKFPNLIYFLKKILRKVYNISPKWNTMSSNTRYVVSEKVCLNFKIMIIDLKLIVVTNHNIKLMQVCSE